MSQILVIGFQTSEYRILMPCFVPCLWALEGGLAFGWRSGRLAWKQSESRLITVELIPAPAWVLGRIDAARLIIGGISAHIAESSDPELDSSFRGSSDICWFIELTRSEVRDDRGASRRGSRARRRRYRLKASGVRRLSIKRTLQGQALAAMCAALRLDPQCGP